MCNELDCVTKDRTCLCRAAREGELHRHPHLRMCVEVQEQREHSACLTCCLEVRELPHPDRVQPHIVIPHLPEALDTGKEIVPFCRVILPVISGHIVYLEFDEQFTLLQVVL